MAWLSIQLTNASMYLELRDIAVYQWKDPDQYEIAVKVPTAPGAKTRVLGSGTEPVVLGGVTGRR